MKFELSNLKLAAAALGLVLCTVFTSGAAQGGNAKPAAGTTVTNAGPPRSIFLKPNNPSEGKDPFYPRSVYPYLGSEKAPDPTPVKTPTPALVDVDVKLNGISGSKEHPLAIINGHTFEAGEEWEVNVGNGNKVHVRCLEIKPEGVLIFVNGQRRELRLRGGL